MGNKKNQDKKAKFKKAEDDFKTQIKINPLNPQKIINLGNFYIEHSLTLSSDEARNFKRKAYETYKNAIKKFDEIKFKKDDDGEPIILEIKIIKEKCKILDKLSKMSGDADLQEIGDEDEILCFQIDKIFYLLRCQHSYSNELQSEDKDVSSQIEEFKKLMEYEIANDKFKQFLIEEIKHSNGINSKRELTTENDQQDENFDYKQEAQQVKFMIQNMAKNIQVGSEWFIVSIKWINKWQKYVRFDQVHDESISDIVIQRPGKIDNSDIIDIFYTNEKNQQISTLLEEKSIGQQWQNYQLKKNLKEGEDYMIVDSNIHQFWAHKYGLINEVKRFGIQDESGENVVEIYLKQFNLYFIPQKSFKLNNILKNCQNLVISQNEQVINAIPIFISKTFTVEELEKKILRILMGFIFYTLKSKIMYKELRLWKSNYQPESTVEDLKELEKKFENFTHVNIDAQLQNGTKFQKKVILYDLEFSDNDIMIVELPKNQEDFVFLPLKKDQDNLQFEDPLNNKQLQELQNNKVSIKYLNNLEIQKLMKKSSQKGLVGLQNLGNTCFMNSGLQCMSNTIELTKYFLFNLYRMDINFDNPLGLNGKLAEAYAGLMQEMWLGDDKRTAPYDLKRVLGKRVARFSGYGQQDACELLNYLLDLIHEDLNRVKKKPYVELPNHDGKKPDSEMSQLFWNAFLARNQSIIVDLMYGQLKSTVKCLECGNISITFDPYLTLALPIAKSQVLEVIFVPFDLFYLPKDASSEEEDSDPDFRKTDSEKYRMVEHYSFKIDTSIYQNVLQIKNYILSKISKIGQPQMKIENLILFRCEQRQVYEIYTDEYLSSNISDQIESYTRIILSEKVKESPKENKKVLELNFSKGQPSKKGQISQFQIQYALPRYQEFEIEDKIIEMKRKIFNRIEHIFIEDSPPLLSKEDNQERDKWINKNVLLYIKENVPYLKAQNSHYSKKADCEFCGRKHSPKDDICDIRTKYYRSGNSLQDGALDISLKDLYSQLKHQRELKFEVLINVSSNATYNRLAQNIVEFDSDIQQNYKKGAPLDQCFRAFSNEELLSGNDQWFCNKCQEHRDIHKKLELFKIPKILIIQLKRFQSKKEANSSKSGFFNLAYAQICQQEKVSELVDFPLEGLDVSKYIKVNSGESQMYDLFAVTNHFGSLNGGHYTAFGKNINDQWYNFNDSSVSSASTSNIVSEAAYLLFYRRREQADQNELSNNDFSQLSTVSQSDFSQDQIQESKT